MPNSFLGFPVPRARIADMIASAAPPSLHHTQHENGGSDEIDATGLTGTGGAGFDILKYFDVSDTFNALNSSDQSVSGSGSVTLNEGSVTMDTGVTANSIASTTKFVPFDSIGYNFGVTIAATFPVTIISSTSVTGNFTVITGRTGTLPHCGFKVVAGILYGTVGNNSTETTVALLTIAATSYTAKYTLSFVFTPATDCKFYVDGVLKGTISTNLPTSAHEITYYMQSEVSNPAVAQSKSLLLACYNVRLFFP